MTERTGFYVFPDSPARSARRMEWSGPDHPRDPSRPARGRGGDHIQRRKHMGFKRVLNSRIAAVGAGAAALAVLAGGAGYAAGEITSHDIQDNTIRSADVQDESLKMKDLATGAQKQLKGDHGRDVRCRLPGREVRQRRWGSGHRGLCRQRRCLTEVHRDRRRGSGRGAGRKVPTPRTSPPRSRAGWTGTPTCRSRTGSTAGSSTSVTAQPRAGPRATCWRSGRCVSRPTTSRAGHDLLTGSGPM